MSGHSHWSRIKRKKAVTDHRRGREFSKVARLIIMAARSGGGDPSMNLSLRYAMDKARSINMTNDAIDRAVKRGTGEGNTATYEDVIYEGYGQHGVAVFVEGLTDNRNRTAGEVRKIFEIAGGALGGPNCVAWMFHKKGIITVPAGAQTEDQMIELALEAGAEDVTPNPEGFEVTCAPASLEAVKKALADKGVTIGSAEHTMIPDTTVPLDAEQATKLMRLIENLEDNEDVQNVYANFDIPEEVMAQLSK
ncbi:MAG: YebC/PmpR family DNA-binding transcriptional regulator [Phycisphaerae bacterium]|nr:YebC/PmpR family DNA-binding transcriptional regulator [Phycisphaerae bacterium]